MPRKKHTPEEIVAKLWQVDVLVSQGTPVAEAVRQIGVTEVTYHRWRHEYGGLKLNQVKRLKEREVRAMTVFDPPHGFIGGTLIGSAAVLLMRGLGRIAGICGIALNVLTGRDAANLPWRVAFLVGLPLDRS